MTCSPKTIVVAEVDCASGRRNSASVPHNVAASAMSTIPGMVAIRRDILGERTSGAAVCDPRFVRRRQRGVPTNPPPTQSKGGGDFSPRRRADLSQLCVGLRYALDREQVVDRLAATDHARVAAHDENGRRPRHGVVGRSHRERVCAGRRDGEHVPSPRRGQLHRVDEHVSRFAVLAGYRRRLRWARRRRARRRPRCTARRRAAAAGCPRRRRRLRPRSRRPSVSPRPCDRASRPRARRASVPVRGSRARARRARRAASPRTRRSTAPSLRGASEPRARRRGRSPPASSRPRSRNPLSHAIVSRAEAVPRSWDPTWTCRPSTCGASASASSGATPNFEPAWPVRIDSCVSASIPGVTRTSIRPTPASRARSSSSTESRTTYAARASAAAASSSSDLLLPCTTSRSPSTPARWAKRSSPSVETSAPRPSSASSRRIATFGNALVP